MTATDEIRNAALAAYAGSDAADFLRHRPPLMLLDRLVSSRDDLTVCELEVIEGGPFVQRNLGIPAYIGIEIMAQCIAVHAGVRARSDGLGPPLGFLLGTRHFQSRADWISPGQRCQASCRELMRDANGMGSYDCNILARGEPVAQARLSVYESEPGRKIDDD